MECPTVKVSFGDIRWARVEDVRVMMTTGAWRREDSDRERQLHWIAMALGSCAAESSALAPVLRAALGEEEWTKVVEIGRRTGPVPCRDMTVANDALTLRVREFHERGRLPIDEESSKVASAEYAHNYAQDLLDRLGARATPEHLSEETAHLEDDDSREAILREFRRLAQHA